MRRWGLRTLGDLTALPPADVAARLGQAGVQWQRLARGEDPAPLVPAVPEERFEQALDLEWPIEGLEPLSFVLGRLLEPMSAHLERRDRGAAVLHVRLHLVSKTTHERSLQLPAPLRDARDAAHARAARSRVASAGSRDRSRGGGGGSDACAGPAGTRSITRPLPSPEQVSTLMARLTALMGEGRCGSPAAVDSWRPGAFAMAPFAPQAESLPALPRRERAAPPALPASAAPQATVVVALRRFRHAVPARVQVEHGRPVRVTTNRRGLGGGRIEKCGGPWRTSGEWWKADAFGVGGAGEAGRSENNTPWDRDEWDVTVSDGATYRLFRERDANAWFIDGVLD